MLSRGSREISTAMCMFLRRRLKAQRTFELPSSRPSYFLSNDAQFDGFCLGRASLCNHQVKSKTYLQGRWRLPQSYLLALKGTSSNVKVRHLLLSLVGLSPAEMLMERRYMSTRLLVWCLLAWNK